MNAGIAFHYGVIFDLHTRTLAEIRDEIDFITSTPRISLPAFVNLSIPILRTPYFYECLEKGAFLPATKLRDMDGNTLVLHPKDSIAEAVEFLDGMSTLRGFRLQVARHVLNFWCIYRRKLTVAQLISCVGNGALLCLPALAHNHSGLLRRNAERTRRTYVTTTEPEGPLYRPFMRVNPAFQEHFRPTMVTDEAGKLSADVADDLLCERLAASPGKPGTVMA